LVGEPRIRRSPAIEERFGAGPERIEQLSDGRQPIVGESHSEQVEAHLNPAVDIVGTRPDQVGRAPLNENPPVASYASAMLASLRLLGRCSERRFRTAVAAA
jgi:hypothetical protein